MRVAAEVNEYERSPLQRGQRSERVQDAGTLHPDYGVFGDVGPAVDELLDPVGELGRSLHTLLARAPTGEVEHPMARDRG